MDNDASFSKRKDINKSLFHRLWHNYYRNFVIQNQSILELGEDVLYKILFWVRPTTNSSSSSLSYNDTLPNNGGVWREICYGLLSLHRLGMELALQQHPVDDDEDDDDDGRNHKYRKNSYGTTVQTLHPPTIAATSVRIFLTVLQSMVPSVLAIAQSYSSSFTTTTTVKKNVRLFLEQVKFVLRIYLLVNYWKQQQQQLQQQQQISTLVQQQQEYNPTRHPTTITLGILMNGGLYQTYRPMVGLGFGQAQAMKRRQDYVGRRTGWKLESSSSDCINNTAKNPSYNNINNNKDRRNYSNVMVIMAELLHTFRPLLWAWCEARYPMVEVEESQSQLPVEQQGQPQQYHLQYHHQQRQQRRIKSPPINQSILSPTSKRLLYAWWICLGLDIVSLRLLLQSSSSSSSYRNPVTQEELRQRKMRLWLYALRSPVWDHIIKPIMVDQFLSQRILQQRFIPSWLGNILEIFMMDWISYHRHPFIAEEQ
jgi:hypothetical protein